MDLSEQVSKLQESIPNLPAKDHGFAENLVSYYKKKGYLSDKQSYWVGELLQRAGAYKSASAVEPSPPKLDSSWAQVGRLYWVKDGVFSYVNNEPAPIAKPAMPLASPNIGQDYVEVGDFTGVVALFASAQASNLQKPKITMTTPAGLILNVMPYKGSVKLTQGSGKGHWLGYVTLDGRWLLPSWVVQWVKDDVTEVLKQLSLDPVGTTALYGKLAGKCCFCNHPLTDEKSTKHGYGPVCAKKWFLPWG